MKRALLVTGVAVLAIACARVPVISTPAARTDLYVLLPSAGGAPGALVVVSEGQTQTLDRPYTAATVGRPGAIETATTTDAEVNTVFAPALTAQPPRPASFTLYFLLDSDELTPESQRVIPDVVSEISRRPVPEVVIIGHTDTTGSDERNDRLSLQRAERVRAQLIQRGLGIASSNVFAVGRGTREPLVPTGDQVAEPRNRRVELVVR